DQLDQVTPFVQQLGRDHRRFNVVAKQYDAVGASLLATLQHFLATTRTDSLAADWAAAYQLVASVMIDAAEDAATSSPSVWPAQIISVERRSFDVCVLQLRPEQKLSYLPGQSLALESPDLP